jgi:hypothetical protein
MSGRAMKQHLISLGLLVQDVRKRDNAYEAGFHTPHFDKTDSAKTWASRICDVIPNAEIVATHDTIASWRDGTPVIYASVIFRQAE